MCFQTESDEKACFQHTVPSATLFDTKEMSAETLELSFAHIQRVSWLKDALTVPQSLLEMERLLVHQVEVVDATLDAIANLS